jgi:hypothetical protein
LGFTFFKELALSQKRDWTIAAIAFDFGHALWHAEVIPDRYDKLPYDLKVSQLVTIAETVHHLTVAAIKKNPDFDFYLAQDELMDLVVDRFKRTGAIYASAVDYEAFVRGGSEEGDPVIDVKKCLATIERRQRTALLRRFPKPKAKKLRSNRA